MTALTTGVLVYCSEIFFKCRRMIDDTSSARKHLVWPLYVTWMAARSFDPATTVNERVEVSWYIIVSSNLCVWLYVLPTHFVILIHLPLGGDDARTIKKERFIVPNFVHVKPGRVCLKYHFSRHLVENQTDGRIVSFTVWIEILRSVGFCFGHSDNRAV